MSGSKVALVTGASAGLGIAFVHQLAARGYDIALTARSVPAMEEIAVTVSARYGVNATLHPQDLTVPGSADALMTQLDQQGIRPDVLINNAAFGLYGPFVGHDPDQLTAMLQLNMVSLAELTLGIGKAMAARGHGHILLVGSGSAYLPTPTMAGYGATKAFLLSLGVALNVELAPKVGVTVLSPGALDTGFNKVSGLVLSPSLKRTIMPVEQVAKVGLDAMFAGKTTVIPGGRNRMNAFLTRLLPRRVAAKAFESATKR